LSNPSRCPRRGARDDDWPSRLRGRGGTCWRPTGVVGVCPIRAENNERWRSALLGSPLLRETPRRMGPSERQSYQRTTTADTYRPPSAAPKKCRSLIVVGYRVCAFIRRARGRPSDGASSVLRSRIGVRPHPVHVPRLPRLTRINRMDRPALRQPRRPATLLKWKAHLRRPHRCGHGSPHSYRPIAFDSIACLGGANDGCHIDWIAG
jgi:hypothetical protein